MNSFFADVARTMNKFDIPEIAAVLSCVACIWLFWNYYKIHRITIGQKMILTLAIADFIASFALLISDYFYSGEDNDFITISDGAAFFSIFWASNIAYFLYLIGSQKK